MTGERKQGSTAIKHGDATPVIVMNLLLDPEPVFHVRGSFDTTTLDDGSRLSQQRTLCGLLIYRNVWNRETLKRSGWVEKGTAIRRDHASMIGRICSRCGAAENGSEGLSS